jgi:hypothetical protein
MKTKWTLILLAVSGFAHAEGVVGNGGDVVYCPGRPTPVEMLDVYEARVIRGIKIDMGASMLTAEQKADLAFSRLGTLSPVRSQNYRQWLKEFESEALYVANADLVGIPDSQHIVIPVGCQIKQLVIQNTPKFPGDKRYTICKDLWDQMDTDNRAAMIIHEVIYREAIEVGVLNSIGSRYLAGALMVDRLKAMFFADFVPILRNLGLYWGEYKGISLWIKGNVTGDQYPVEFHSNGVVRHAQAQLENLDPSQ